MDNPLRVYDNMSEVVGCTPLVKLKSVLQKSGISGYMGAKCEFLNPGSSFKDRLARAIITQKEKSDSAKKEISIEQETTFDYAVGLSLAAITYRTNLKIKLTNDITTAKLDLLEAMGTSPIFDTPTDNENVTVFETEDQADSIDLKEPKTLIDKEISNFSTEVYQQMNHKVNYVFLLEREDIVSKLARSFQKIDPHVNIVGISLCGIDDKSHNEKHTSTNGQGSHEFYNDSTISNKNELVKAWIEISNNEALVAARELIQKDACIVGKLSGAVFAGAVKYLKLNNLHEEKDLRCVIVLSDSAKSGLCDELAQTVMIGKGIYPVKDFSPTSDYCFEGKSIKDFLSLLEHHASSKCLKKIVIETCGKYYNR